MGGEEVDFRFKISDLRSGQSGGAIACGGTVEDKTGNVKLRANHGPPFRQPLNGEGAVFRVIWRGIGQIGQVGRVGQVGLMRWGGGRNSNIEYRTSNFEW